jgi:TIGR03009 family protein
MLLAAGFAFGLCAAEPAAQAPDKRITQLVQRWAIDAVQTASLWVKIQQTRTNPVFRNAPPEIREGEAKFMKLADGSFGARIELANPQDPNDFERFIYTGTHLYQLRSREKVVNVVPLGPQQASSAPEDSPLGFLYGMSAESAWKRYKIAVTKEYDGYLHVQITPNFARDQQEFTRAELAIVNRDQPKIPKDMPKYISFVEPNNVQVTWYIDELRRNAGNRVQAKDFAPPAVPPGWQKVVQPAPDNVTTR